MNPYNLGDYDVQVVPHSEQDQATTRGMFQWMAATGIMPKLPVEKPPFSDLLAYLESFKENEP